MTPDQATFLDNAQYWLGEAYYVNHDYTNALAAFQRVVDKYPQSRKVPDALLKVITFAIFSFPAIAYLGLMTSHSIHHRGQLSTYLRPMGSKIPAIYGGSADEPVDLTAAQRAKQS